MTVPPPEGGEALDRRVRMDVFERLLADGRAPTTDEMASDLGITTKEIAAAYRRLAERRRLVLRAGTTEILMANPLSAVPTAFGVETQAGSYFGNCIWDALGVIAMLGDSGRVLTSCGDGCGEAMTVTIEHDVPVDPQGIIHFQVPRARWWDDIVFT
jgi:DNA-binding transcriptional MocR family regulator